MAEAGGIIDFVEFMEQFRQQETDNNDERATLNDTVDILMPTNVHEELIMDRSPRDEREFLVFDALVGRKELTRLIFGQICDASCVPHLISRIEKGTLPSVTLGGMPLSGSQATAISENMLNIALRWFATFLTKDYGSEVIDAFQHFLQESSIRSLSLCCHRGEWISIEAIQSICMGILNSSVKRLYLIRLKVRGVIVERIHEILAEMILDSSSSIEKIQVVANEEGDISLQLLSRALCQHPVIQNLDISFCPHIRHVDALVFDFNPWWKRLLPLNLWPLLLEKADTWKREASHGHLDILYFLLKEKNTELLQNVRRRRIRKRKRYGFSA